MPLDKEKGESIEGMDHVFRIAPVEKWSAMDRLTAEIELPDGPFRKKKVARPIWEIAYNHAVVAFADAGAVPGSKLEYDVTVQEYPRTGIVCFIFCASILGKEYYVAAPFILTDSQIADLQVRNLWQATVH